MVTVTRILSPLGPLFAGATTEGICLLEFADRRMLETTEDLRLATEAPTPTGGDERGVDDLQRDATPERFLFGLVVNAHSTPAEE